MSASIVHQVNTALTTVWVCKIAQQVTFVTVECIYLLRTPPILQQNNAQQVIIAQQAACKRLSAHLELSKMVFKLPNVNHVLQVLIKGKVDKSHALAVPLTQTKITGIVQLDQFCLKSVQSESKCQLMQQPVISALRDLSAGLATNK